MTASEPLTLEEEYEMQESWHVDENKCTFIILAKEGPDQEITPENALAQEMVGDVNLFFNDHDDPHSAEIEIMIAGGFTHLISSGYPSKLKHDEKKSTNKKSYDEKNLSEPSYRRKGMGLEAIRMMITYAYESLGTKRITAKISTENEGSIQLFLNQLGFVQIGYSQIFAEVTLERLLTSSENDLVETSKQGEEDKDKDETFGQPALTQTRFKTLELNSEDLGH
ncbi:N-acetyltransferase 9 [Mortierella sp. GBA30]|nr:N-acetyltransferase 9 [Mortierella sp. GBA30]